MTGVLELPTGNDLVPALETLIQPALVERNLRQVWWYITDFYMRGVRSFKIIDYATGEVEVNYEDDEENVYGDEEYEGSGVPFRWEEGMHRIRTEIGRLKKLNLYPKIGKKEHSLSSLKGAASAQVMVDHMLLGNPWEVVTDELITHTILYGTAGFAHWREELPDTMFGCEIETVPVWELLSIPGGTSIHGSERVLCRSRIFPLTQLKKMQGVKINDEAELDVLSFPYGQSPGAIGSRDSEAGGGFAGSYRDMFDKGNRYNVQDKATLKGLGNTDTATYDEKFVRLREFFVHGPKNTLARYIVMAGRKIVIDIDYQKLGEKIPRPIGIARYMDTGNFYGKSFSSFVIPFALRLERLVHDLIRNVDDLDRFGFLMVPRTIGIDFEDFKAGGSPRIITYEPDPTSKVDPVHKIQPVTASDIPGKVAQFGMNLLDKTTAQGPLYSGQAPGRAESGESFKSLAELGSTHLATPSSSLKEAVGTVTRSMVYQVADTLENKKGARTESIAMARIENHLAGIKINPDTGEIDLEKIAVPDPWAYSYGVESDDPTSMERRRSQALEMLQGGMLTPLEFIIMNYRENWDYPLGQTAVWEQYIKAVMQNLILFGDGETPGNISGNTNFDKPEIHLLAMDEFTSTAEFGLSSEAVQDAFVSRQKVFKPAMAGTLPDGMLYPEEAAAQANVQGQPSAQPPGGPQAPGQSVAPPQTGPGGMNPAALLAGAQGR